ncbi:hypothetical protein HAX54_050275, partial [Datura stramonium]|nr:hypothetical protein [Datura stramonium]
NKDNGGFELKASRFGHAFHQLAADLNLLNAGVKQMGLPCTYSTPAGHELAPTKCGCPYSCICYLPVNHILAPANHR